MKLGTRVNHVNQRERKRDLLDAVEGVPTHHKAAMVSRILKDVIAGKITAAEANEMRKASKI